MKTLALSACLAVSTTAGAAEANEPAQVAADWNRMVEEARAPLLSPGLLGLGTSAPGALTVQHGAAPWTPPPPRPRRNGDVLEVPPGLRMDPGIQKIVPDDGMPPPGARPWYYRGQKFWIIPIDRPGEEKAASVGPLYDAPNYRVPMVLPNSQPPGAKPK